MEKKMKKYKVEGIMGNLSIKAKGRKLGVEGSCG